MRFISAYVFMSAQDSPYNHTFPRKFCHIRTAIKRSILNQLTPKIWVLTYLDTHLLFSRRGFLVPVLKVWNGLILAFFAPFKNPTYGHFFHAFFQGCPPLLGDSNVLDLMIRLDVLVSDPVGVPTAWNQFSWFRGSTITTIAVNKCVLN